jgi:glutathione S-transferase
MLKLYGFSLSNYYNKVKLALLEKGVPFEEVLISSPEKAGHLGMSPLGKVPYIETEQGSLCESAVIMDYIEAQWPTPALMPTDVWAVAKHREITHFLELHVELCVRQLYVQAFFGGTLPEKFTARVKGDLARNLAAFKQLAVFGPYVAGDTFSAADCAAYVHLPLAALASKIVYGEDMVAAVGIDWKSYVKLIEQRPSAQKVAADRKADQDRALAVQRAKVAGL